LLTPPPTHTYTLSLHDALPIYRRKLEHKLARIFWQVLADHHDGGAHLPQISSHGQVLLTHTLSVDPHPETHVLGNHFLGAMPEADRKSTRLNSSHDQISYAVFC